MIVNDYSTQLEKMMPPLNTNFLTPCVLNIIKQLSNNKASSLDKVFTVMLKNSSFKIIVSYIIYIIYTPVILYY